MLEVGEEKECLPGYLCMDCPLLILLEKGESFLICKFKQMKGVFVLLLKFILILFVQFVLFYFLILFSIITILWLDLSVLLEHFIFHHFIFRVIFF